MQKLKWTAVGILATLLIIGISVWAYFRYNTSEGINPYQLIPQNAIYIFESDEPIENWEKLRQNKLWNFLNTHPYFASLKKDADYLSELIDEQKFLMKSLGHRKLIFSAHPISKNDYDFLFAIDLSSGKDLIGKGDLLPDFLTNIGFKVLSRTKNDRRIIECKDPSSREILYLSQIENYLLCSYNLSIVENAIEEYENPRISKDENFQKVLRKVEQKGLGQWYVNWDYMDEYLAMYSKGNNEWLTSIFASLSYAAFDLQLGNEELKMPGYARVKDSSSSYLQALLHSGKSNSEAADILSNRTAFCWSLCFDKMDVFYRELMKVFQQNEAQFASFEKTKNRVEKYLQIDLEKHLISWMGKEVVLARNKQFKSHGQEEYIALIHALDKEKAAENLQYITQQIKKRTPARFKEIHFRSYTIRYLEFKGLFRALFGSLFDDMEKPYYTVIGDYVAFSNSAMGLIGLIEDYENKRVLASEPAFKSSYQGPQMLSIYVAPHNTYEVFRSELKPGKAADLSKSKAYFEGFSAFSLSLSSRKDLIYIHSSLLRKGEESENQLKDKDLRQLWQQRVEINTIDQDGFTLRIIEDGVYKQYYPDNRQLFIRAHTKWGIMHGKYTEYHENGTVKCKGKYKKGQRTGQWRFYDEKGELQSKKRY